MAEYFGSDFILMEQLLAQFDIDVTAAEADGRLSGLAAMNPMLATDVWLRGLITNESQAVDARRVELAEPLRILAHKRIAVLEAAESLPVLCLPGDDEPLVDRVESIVDWSTGFLSGLAEGAALHGKQAVSLLQQPPLDEMLADLTEITRAVVPEAESDDDGEQEESAYAELVEFLRLACQLAFETLSEIRMPAENNVPPVIH